MWLYFGAIGVSIGCSPSHLNFKPLLALDLLVTSLLATTTTITNPPPFPSFILFTNMAFGLTMGTERATALQSQIESELVNRGLGTEPGMCPVYSKAEKGTDSCALCQTPSWRSTLLL